MVKDFVFLEREGVGETLGAVRPQTPDQRE